jgi:hypothetical protein
MAHVERGAVLLPTVVADHLPGQVWPGRRVIQGFLDEATVGHGKLGENANAHGLDATGLQVTYLFEAAR